MYFSGLLIGIISFILIGIYHPIVVKGEYHFGVKIWPIFLIIGIICICLSIFISNIVVSSILGVLAFTNLWTIGELKEQKQRVEKGWFPKNPKKNKTS